MTDVAIHCAARDRLASKEIEFSILVADIYRLTNRRRRRASGTKEEKESKRGRTSDFCEALPIHQR